MNKLKIYLRTKGNINEILETLASVFKGKILKKSYLNEGDLELNEKDPKTTSIVFGYLNILGDINIMVAKYKDKFPAYGYAQDNVINFEDQDEFLEIFTNLQESDAFTMDYGITKRDWGTSITKFYDKWGNGWVLETRT